MFGFSLRLGDLWDVGFLRGTIFFLYFAVILWFWDWVGFNLGLRVFVFSLGALWVLFVCVGVIWVRCLWFGGFVFWVWLFCLCDLRWVRWFGLFVDLCLN